MTELVCRMCGETYAEHLDARRPGAPVPRNGCGSLKRYFVARGAPTSWIKLRRGNDWGFDYFAIEPLSNGGASKSRGIKVEEGDDVRVRMADGEIVSGVITLSTEWGSVTDSGHTYPVKSEIPHVAFTWHGQLLRIRIDEVEVDEAWARSKGAQ